MGFHEGASELSGGFLGVDIFFVLSGFLITDLLAVQYDLIGRLDLKDFWARRARRLLPALAVMLVVVAAAAILIEPDSEGSLREALLAAVTYTSNWYQVLHHVSYFGSLGPPPPLEHLWSLAIEEQFYIVWPVILWFFIFRLNGRRARVTATLIAAGLSALAMVLQYAPGANPSAVYYGTDTHASALLVGAALALAYPLSTLAVAAPALTKRLDAAGVLGLAALAWAIGHFSGDDPAVYPVGLILAALGAAGLVAAAASNGVIAALTSLRPLRWVGLRSYGIYLWHWPVIALTAALEGSGPTSAWVWFIETAVTLAVAAASWRFIETPIARDGLRATWHSWHDSLVRVRTRQAARPARATTIVVTGATVFALAAASYGVVRPPSDAPAGLLQQVAQGERVSAASQSTQAAQTAPAGQTPRAGQSSAGQSSAGQSSGRSPSAHKVTGAKPAAAKATASGSGNGNGNGKKVTASCPRGALPKVSGDQVTAVGDSVMVASATALEAAMPGSYINAQVGRQMQSGLAIVQSLAASGDLRHIVVVGLGTNGAVTASQVRELRKLVGPERELILVNTYGPQSWEHEVNAVLAAAGRNAARVELANWDQAIAARTGLLWPDGIHPQPAGAKLYAHVVLTAIQADLSRSQPASCPQARLRPLRTVADNSPHGGPGRYQAQA
jgi:peptidoglycan/LPS O-acetylase OafA/YrhL